MAMQLQPARGLRFEHAKWLDERNQPLACVVTAVRRKAVYWRRLDGGGAPSIVGIEDFGTIVRRVLEPAVDHPAATPGDPAGEPEDGDRPPGMRP